MSITKSLTMAVLATTISFSAVADSGHHDDEKAVKTSTETPMAAGQMPMMAGQQGGMPMMQGQPGGMPMMQGQQGGMPMMQMMQERHAMMQAHMTKMETHMANIEALLRQLVELQKK